MILRVCNVLLLSEYIALLLRLLFHSLRQYLRCTVLLLTFVYHLVDLHYSTSFKSSKAHRHGSIFISKCFSGLRHGAFQIPSFYRIFRPGFFCFISQKVLSIFLFFHRLYLALHDFRTFNFTHDRSGNHFATSGSLVGFYKITSSSYFPFSLISKINSSVRLVI